MEFHFQTLKNTGRGRTHGLSQKGYTAVELVLALAILGAIIFSTLSVYKMISRTYWQVDEKARLERTIVFTMDQMVSEIRQARSMNTLSATAGTVTNLTTVHLDPAGTITCAFMLPNLTNPDLAKYDAKLIYFLRTLPDGTVKLYQRMVYYDGTQTQAFPAMANVDQFRLGNPATVSGPITILKEPTPGGAQALPGAWTTAYDDSLGRIAGAYNSSDLNFDDVAFYFDNVNTLLAVGLTVSVKSKSLSGGNVTKDSRRRLTLTNSVALRKD